MRVGLSARRDSLWLAAAIVVGGVVTGILAGLFGIGGGAIIVPVLYEVFRVLGVPEEVRMQLCVGTSLAIIVPTTIRSYRRPSRQGRRADGRGAAWALPAVVGVAVGSAHRGASRRRRCSRSRSWWSPLSSPLKLLFGTRQLAARRRSARARPA